MGTKQIGYDEAVKRATDAIRAQHFPLAQVYATLAEAANGRALVLFTLRAQYAGFLADAVEDEERRNPSITSDGFLALPVPESPAPLPFDTYGQVQDEINRLTAQIEELVG
jgi:hypothetical protein